jgi:AraC family transcriptional regulator
MELRRLHWKCVHHVIDHVSSCIGEEHNVQELADVAGFSRFHFQRLFKDVSGETLFECIRRMRLERAATLLTVAHDKTILDIALETGFSSSPVFARAFHSRFGMTASQWRDGDFWWYNGEYWDWRNKDLRDQLKKRGKGRLAGTGRLFYLDLAQADAADGKRPNCLSELVVQRLPECRIAYIRRFGLITFENMNATWRRFRDWAKRVGSVTPDSTAIGLFQDSPTIVASRYVRHDIGLVVGPGFTASPDVDIQTIPGGLYLVGRFDGFISQAHLATEYIWQHWLSANGWCQDARRPVHSRVRLGDGRSSDAINRFLMHIPVRASGEPF